MIKHLFIWINLFVTFILLSFAQNFKPEQTVRRGPGSDLNCMSPLISAHDEFPDSAFSASSVLFNKTDFQPYQARLTDVYGSKEHTSGYAWCPNSVVDEMMREWIQAEFTHLVIIKSIFTAGRGDGNVKEFMPSFVLKYQREDDGTWYEHVKRDGTRILKANSDPRNPARATLDSAVIAKRIRIYPYSRKGSRDVCLRFALYGCKFPDGVVSYTIPQGGLRPQTSFRSSSASDTLEPIVARHLKDLSYDGQLISTTYQLTDGLGQLMDNVAFLGNLTRESDLYPSQPGFHFVGWPQNEQGEIQLLFKFDAPRHFTWIRLFTFDSIVLRVRLFSRAVIAFSMNGKTFDNSVEFSTGRVHYYDPQITTTLSRVRRARTPGRLKQSPQSDPRIYVDAEYGGALVIELALGERVGRFLRLTLTAADSWTVLSEVQFNSTIAMPMSVQSNAVAPVVDKTDVVENQDKGLDTSAIQPTILKSSGPSKHDDQSENDSGSDTSPNDNPNGTPSIETKEQTGAANGKLAALLPLVIALGVLLFLLPVAVLIWLCSRRHLKRKQFKCRQKLHPVDGDARAMHRSTPIHILTTSNIPEGVKLLGTGNPQICFPNGSYPSSLQQRLNDPNQNQSLNAALGHNNMTHAMTGTGGAIISGPTTTSADRFDRAVDTTHIYSSTDGNYISPEYASASIFDFPVNMSDASSVIPSSGMDTLPANSYLPAFTTFPAASVAHANPTLTSGADFSIYTGPASMPLGTGTLQLPMRYNTGNQNHIIHPVVGQNPAGLMFVGGIGDMESLYQAAQKNAYNISAEIGRPCSLYKPDIQPPVKQLPNGNMGMPESCDPWLLMPSNQGNHNGPSNANWFADSNVGTIQMLPTRSYQFPFSQTTARMSNFNQFTPQLSPQHFVPSHMPPQPLNQIQQLQQQPLRQAGVPQTPDNESHGDSALNRGSPVGAAAAYLSNIPETSSREVANSGNLSIYSVCT